MNDSVPFERPSPGGMLVYYSQKGVSVKAGDVVGYYIEHSDNPIQLGYSNSTTDSQISHSVVYSLESVDGPLCNISLCDADLKHMTQATPLIHANFSKYPHYS